MNFFQKFCLLLLLCGTWISILRTVIQWLSFLIVISFKYGKWYLNFVFLKKKLVKSNLRKKGFVWVHPLRIQSFTTRKAWCSEHKATNHIVSTVWKHRKMKAGAQFLLVFKLGALHFEWYCPHLGWIQRKFSFLVSLQMVF